MSFQEELAAALENLRNANERNAVLERTLDSTQRELEAAIDMLYKEAQQPVVERAVVGVTQDGTPVFAADLAPSVYVETAPDLDYDLPE